MGRVEASRVAKRIHLDRRVRIWRYHGEISGISGERALVLDGSEVVWAEVRTAEIIASSDKESLFGSATVVTIRWKPQYNLRAGDLKVNVDPVVIDEADENSRFVDKVRAIGRRRFLALELT